MPLAIGVPVVLFIMFEIWFLVPLPKGPFEHGSATDAGADCAAIGRSQEQ